MNPFSQRGESLHIKTKQTRKDNIMSTKNRNGKPTKFQLDALKALKADMKGIKTYRDDENAIRRLRNAKAKKAAPVKKPVAKPTVCPFRKDAANKSITVKSSTKSTKAISVKKPILGTDEIRIKLPVSECVKSFSSDDPARLTVELTICHDDGLFTKEQIKKIDILAKFCQDEIVKMCDSFAAINGLAEVKPTCSCSKSKAKNKKTCACKKTSKKR